MNKQKNTPTVIEPTTEENTPTDINSTVEENTEAELGIKKRIYTCIGQELHSKVSYIYYKVQGTYSLFEERMIALSEGKNQIVIKDGYVYMEYAECPDKLCIKQGAIQNQGESIICLPNKVIVTVNGSEKQEYDGISG